MKKISNLKQLFIFLLIFIFSSSSGCASKETPPSQVSYSSSTRPIVYTSIYPLYDFTQKIGGDKIIVINIAPVGAEPHSFEPSTKLLADLSKSQLFIYNGAGMEPYLEKFLNTLQGTHVLMVEASRGIKLIKHPHANGQQKSTDEIYQETSSLAGSHAETDPHVWLSPSCAIDQGRNILQALIQIDPNNKTYYEKNFQNFKKSLSELDNQYKEALAHCKEKDIVVTHEAFGYLCQAYGLNQIHVMGLNTEAEPTPGKIKKIINLMKKEKINHIFFETLYSPEVAATISRETGAQVLQLNTLGNITAKEMQEGNDYFSIMKENLKNLKQALDFQP
jgi:zinc transport system substrate-binding protein